MRSNNDNDRAPPAFQEYAGMLLASRPFQFMSNLAERGLCWSMRLECWHNNSVPADAALLARVIGYSKAEIETALTPNVMSFFRVKGDVIVCPELDAYKARLADRHERQSAGGKASAAKMNDKGKPRESPVDAGVPAKQSGKQASKPQVSRQLLSKAQQSTEQQSENQSTEGGGNAAFVRDYENTEAAAYARASKGL